MRLSLLSAKKAMKRPSGDQNGRHAVLGAGDRLALERVEAAQPEPVVSAGVLSRDRRARPVGRDRGALESHLLRQEDRGAQDGRRKPAPARAAESRQPRGDRAHGGEADPRRGAVRDRAASRPPALATPASEPSPIQRSSRLTSAALCQRSSGSLARHVLHDAVERRRRHRLHRRDRRGVLLHDRRDERRLARAREGLLARSPSRRAPRPARRCRCARRRPCPRAARAPCTGTCRGSCPPASGSATA